MVKFRRFRLGLAVIVLACPLAAHAVRARVPVLPRSGGLGLLCVPRLGSGPFISGRESGQLSAFTLRALPAPMPAVASREAQALANASPLAGALRQGLSGFDRRDRSGGAGPAALRELYDGQASGRGAAVLVNDEGVGVFGRAAAYYREIRALVEKLKDRVDLGESLDVMDDAYADVWAKLKALEAIALSRHVERHNTHLEETLTWVDGVMQDRGRAVAVHTYRVYFHRSANPRSEIEEGIRRADKYLDDTLRQFARNGKAERALGRFQEVILAFDTRGYREIREHLQVREREVAKAFGNRYRFVYLDDLVEAPASAADMRRELNALTERYRGKGLDKIIEGVIYSRCVGLLLELKTIDHLLGQGYQILQSGRELFDPDGKYVTELDVVGRGPDGRVAVVEAKSARVRLPFAQALRDKVIAKLDCYSRNRELIEGFIGASFDEVVFSFDVGGQLGLAESLQGQEAALSRRYGFPVRFVFINSGAKPPS